MPWVVLWCCYVVSSRGTSSHGGPTERLDWSSRGLSTRSKHLRGKLANMKACRAACSDFNFRVLLSSFPPPPLRTDCFEFAQNWNVVVLQGAPAHCCAIYKICLFFKFHECLVQPARVSCVWAAYAVHTAVNDSLHEGKVSAALI